MLQSNNNQPDAALTDVIDRLAGINPGSPAAVLRTQRADVAKYVDASYDALLDPQTVIGLSLVERTLAALRVAILTESGELTHHYRHRLRELGRSTDAIDAIAFFPASPIFTTREAAILRHTDLLTLEPGAANQLHVASLQGEGLSVREVVTLAQLVAFLSFQVRLLAVTKHSAAVL